VPPASDGPLAFCEDVAARDPAVKALVLRSISDPGYFSHAPDAIAAAKDKARAECLKRQGVPGSDGGVQAPARTTGTLFN